MKIRRSDRTVTTQLEDELIVLNLEKAEYYGLSQGLRELWEIIGQGTTTKDKLLSILSEKFQNPQEEIDSLLENGIKELREEGLIVCE